MARAMSSAVVESSIEHVLTIRRISFFQDIANVQAYHRMGVTYSDLCDPIWMKKDPEVSGAKLNSPLCCPSAAAPLANPSAP